MWVKKLVKTALFLVIIGVFFNACEAMDTLLPTSGHYKVNLHVNNILLDECSFIRSIDKVYPCFEEPVSDDKDVSALIVYLKDFDGEIIGRRVSYDINPEKSNDIIIPVESLDDELPPFTIPADLPMGRYTLVFQIMSGKDILQKTEKTFFYLGENNFSFSGININMPGITDAPLIIPVDTVLMLEAVVDFNKRLNPYIIWYEGKNKISEGKVSNGAGILLWKTPEQSGFFSLRAEVFPIEDFNDYKGYHNEASLLVSSKSKDFNLIEDVPQLMYWYTFEGNLNDLRTAPNESALRPEANNIPVWKGINGTYGLGTGQNHSFSLPKVIIPDDDLKKWQILFRFKTFDDGVIFSVLFGKEKNVSLSLIKEDQRLILLLQSPLEEVSQVLDLPVKPVDTDTVQKIEDPFLIAGISFSILPDQLSAQFNLLGVTVENELILKPISSKLSIKDEFHIVLGFTSITANVSLNTTITSTSAASLDVIDEIDEELPAAEILPEIKNDINALWDEFALYYMPPMEEIIAKLRPTVNEY